MGCSKTMTVENIKALLDACYQAKRARELPPELPKGVSSSYIHYLDTIEGLEAGYPGEGVRHQRCAEHSPPRGDPHRPKALYGLVGKENFP